MQTKIFLQSHHRKTALSIWVSKKLIKLWQSVWTNHNEFYFLVEDQIEGNIFINYVKIYIP